MTTTSSEFSSPEAIGEFLSHCHKRVYPAKAAIIRQGEQAQELYYVVEGSVTVMLEDEKGHEIVLAYLNEGEFFGEVGFFNEDSARTALVRARTRCHIAQISYNKLMTLTDLYPTMIYMLTSQLAARLKNTNRKLGDLAFMDVYGRVARTLLELCDQPEATPHDVGTMVKITRQEISRIVGCSREMVGKVLKDMEEQGQVLIDGKKIVVVGAEPTKPG